MFPTPSLEQSDPYNDGQHHSSVLHQERRGDPLVESVLSDSSTLQMVPNSPGGTESSIHTGETELCRRLFKQTEPSVEERMVAQHSSVRQDSGVLSINDHGPVRDSVKPQNGHLRQSMSRRQGLGTRCISNTLGRDNSIRLPTNCSDSRGGEESQGGELPSNPDRTSVANTSLVLRPTGPTCSSSTRTTQTQEATATAPNKNLSHKSRHSQPTRVARIKQRCLEEGFSTEVANRVADRQRKSSVSLYESHFSAFLGWLSQRHLSLESVTAQLVADYFLFLFNEKKLQYPTISSYRTALSDVLPKFDGFTVGTHPTLSGLLANFQTDRPPQRNRVPDWDLSTVLWKLTESPFEPPKWGSTEEKQFTTWKTVFLLALASSKRASELYAISRHKRDLVFSNKGVTLRSIPGFLPKNQRIYMDPKPFEVPSLDEYVGRELPDRLLCPVRMLKYYVKFTGGLSDANERLFVKIRGEGSVVSRTISSWLKKCIIFCHNDKLPKHAVKGHQVRRMSSSWAFFTGVKVNDILAAGSWATPSTFSSYYLADVHHQLDGRYRFVVSSTIPPSH